MSDQPWTEMATGELVKRALDDAEALEHLIARFARRVRSVVRFYGMSLHDAQDAEQTVWFSFWQHLPLIRTPEHAGAWLAAATHNACRKQLKLTRRLALEDPVQLDMFDTPAARDRPTPEEHLLATERRRRVYRAITELAEPDRTIAILDMDAPRASASYVADFTGLPLDRVPSARRRARRRLRRLLIDDSTGECP
ncbi:sigma-70 family RNA polymerase sigma factor [Nocardiopsis rhodophaea]|uniref:RNA polymerase sigma factor n=1 Tax=Nocardiopsis rhodophaea TaxID=280238 RepID=UPI0031DDA942